MLQIHLHNKHLILTALKRSEFLLDAPNFVFHRLIAVCPGSESHAAGNSWHTRRMQGFMALLHGCEDSVPIALDVGAVRVKMCLEPCRPKDTLTNGDFLGNRNADSDRNDAQVCNDVHSPIVKRLQSDNRPLALDSRSTVSNSLYNSWDWIGFKSTRPCPPRGSARDRPS